jgi:hypothetical protein
MAALVDNFVLDSSLALCVCVHSSLALCVCVFVCMFMHVSMSGMTVFCDCVWICTFLCCMYVCMYVCKFA